MRDYGHIQADIVHNLFEESVPFGQINVTIIYIITNKINMQIKIQREYKGEEMFRKYLALDF